MKKIFAFIVLILVFSCTAKKTVTKSDVSQKNDIVATVENHVSDSTQGNTTTNASSSDGTQTTITTVVYDTEKPIEEKTGKPPVKSETTKIIKKDVSQNVTSKADFTTIYNDSTKKETVDKSQIKTKTEVSVTPKKSTFAYIYYILVIGILIVAGFFVYKKFGVIKTFFGFK